MKQTSLKSRSIYGNLRKRSLHPNSLSQREWAYVAGVFDGEGCVLARYRKGLNGHELRFSITNTHQDLLEWLCQRLGGYLVKSAANRHTKSACFAWQLGRANDCYVMAHMILPYTIVKKEKLLAALAFCEEKWQLHEREGELSVTEDYLPPT